MGETLVFRVASVDVIRRAVVTGAVVGLVAVGSRIPLPFVDLGAIQTMSRGGTFPLGLFALGLAPFVSAFVLVEVVALAVPALRGRRHGSFAERAPLTRAAWMAGLVLAGIQAYGIVTYLRAAPGPFGFPLLVDEGWLPLLVTGLTLVAGSALVAFGASVVGSHGLGNGFAVLIAALPLTELPRRLAASTRELPGIAFAGFAAVVLILVLATVFFAWMLRARVGVVPAVPIPTSGILPFSAASSVLLLPAILTGWFPSMAGWAGALHPGGGAFEGAYVILVLALSLLAARLFCAPRPVMAAWSAAGLDAPEQESTVRLALSTANALSVLLLLAIAAAPLGLAKLGLPVALRPALIHLLVVTAVVLDVAAEVRARRDGELVAVCPLHRVYAAEPILAALSRAGIRAHFRARHFRSMLHFFGPYAPIEVLVPAERAPQANEICARIAREIQDA